MEIRPKKCAVVSTTILIALVQLPLQSQKVTPTTKANKGWKERNAIEFIEKRIDSLISLHWQENLQNPYLQTTHRE